MFSEAPPNLPKLLDRDPADDDLEFRQKRT